MNIVDSSGWLELVAGGRNAMHFVQVLEEGRVIVPSITLYEVGKRVRLFGTSAQAQAVESQMRRFPVVDLDAERAGASVAVSLAHKLPMADSIIYAAALEFGATVWTQDDDFDGLPQVRYFAKTSPRKKRVRPSP